MGIGITASIKTPGLFKEKTRKSIKAYFEGLPSIVPGQDVHVFEDEDGFQARLVPFEENVFVRFEENKTVISAKTNSAGPGYHAYFVNVLDELIRKTGTKHENVNIEDETDYYSSRDFGALQSSMKEWAVGLAGMLVDYYGGQDNKNLAVSLPLDQTPVSEDGFVCYPLGYLDEITFRKMRREEDLEMILPRFFLWWDDGQTADFYRKTALMMMWQEINWLPPLAMEEGGPGDGAYRSALACLEKAWAIDETLDYPEAEWLEIAELIGDKELSETLKGRFPEAPGREPAIGFLRGWVSSMLPAGWRIEHPGKMYFDDSDGSVWWDDDLTLRVSILSFQPQDGKESDPKETLRIINRDGSYEPFELKNKETPAVIKTEQIEEDGKSLWQTSLNASTGNTLLLASLYYAEKETESLALKICKSLSA